MDPPSNIIPEVLQGAYFTIQKFQPKLAVGVYHGHDSIFEIPLLLKKYVLNTAWHLDRIPVTCAILTYLLL